MNLDLKVIAHRGIFDNIKIPENSLQSFKKAINKSYPFELDVQLTKDNFLVVFHDDNLKRMTGIDKNIQDTTYEEIKNLNLLNSDCKIPLFSDVLKLNNDKVYIDIEVKTTSRLNDTVDKLMSELHGYNKFIIKSFDPRIVRYIKKKYPNIICGFLIKNNYSNKFYNYILKSKFILKYCKCDFVSISKKLYKNKKFTKIIKNFPLQLWTIDNLSEVNYKDNITYICNNIESFTK